MKGLQATVPRGALPVSAFVAALFAIVSIVGVGGATGWLGVETSTAGILVPGLEAQHAINLALGLPLLVVAMIGAHRGSLAGLLAWPGLLVFVTYTFIRFAVGAPFDPMFLGYVALVVVPLYAAVHLVTSIDVERVHAGLVGIVPARITGGVMIFLGIATLGQDASGAITAANAAAGTDPVARAIWFADLALEVPAMVLCGFLLWRRRPIAYVVAPGLLLQFGLTPVGIASVIALQPWLTGASVDYASVIGLLVFAAISLAPLLAFLRFHDPEPLTS